LCSSSNNTITNCSVYNNSYGILFDSSPNNILRNNVLKNNMCNFGVFGENISHYYQDIDTSNTINGKPIYYIVGQNNLLFNSSMSVGYLGFVSCTNIRVENLTFANNGPGLLLVNTSSSTITNCVVYNNSEDGIYLLSSSNNIITNCNVYNNFLGIDLLYSSNNNITNCTISNSGSYDIYLTSSSSTTTINTTFAKTKVYFGDTSSTLTVKYYLHVKVINSTSSPIPGANVRVRDNANGTFDQNYTTGSDGWVRWVECTEYWQNQTTIIYYTQHNVTVSKTGYVTSYSEPNMDSNKEITITLSTAAVNNPPNPPTLISPANNTWTNDSTPYFDWGFSDPDAGNTQGGFYVQIDNVSDFSMPEYECNNTTSSNTHWQCMYTLYDEIWYWRVKTKDNNGAWGNWSGYFVLKIDTTIPAITISGVTDGAYYNTNVTPIIEIIEDNLNTSAITLNNGTFTSGTEITAEGIYYLNVTADDLAGNSNKRSIIFTIDKTKPPVPSLFSPEDDSIVVTNTPAFVWSGVIDELSGLACYEIQVDDNPDFMSLNWSSSPTGNTTISSALPDGTYYWRVRAVDNAGNTGDWSEVWSFTIITENQAPVIESWSPTSNPTINETDSMAFSIVASDINNDDLTYAWYLDGEITGENSNSYTFVSDYDSAGIYVVNVTVSDGVYYVPHEWTLTVTNVNRPPTIETIGDKTAYEGQVFNLQISATDLDSDILTFSDNTTLFNINPSIGLISFTPNYDSAGVYFINITVTDAADIVWQTFKLTIINVNRVPIINSTSPTDNPTIYEGQSQTFSIDAYDPDGSIPEITWKLDGNTVGVDTSYSFSANYTSSGQYVVNVTVTDGEYFVYHQWTLTVNNVNRAPVIESYSPEIYSAINETESQTFTVNASDPDGNSIGYAWFLNNTLVAGETNSRYTFTSTYGSSGVYNITVVITDNGTPMLSVNHSWTLWVSTVNVPPVADFVYYEGIQVANGDWVNITLRVSGEKWQTLNMTVYANSETVGFLSILRETGSPDNQSQSLEITIDSSKQYTITLNYTSNGNGASPTRLTINYKNISNKMHLVFNANKDETQTRMFNLTEMLDMMIRGVCLIKFESISYDPDGSITNYEWGFDGERMSAGMVVYHYYTTGAHTVGLTVTDNEGASGTVYRNITVLDAVEYYSGYRGMVGVTLDCPADLLITDKYGSKIGFENGEVVNFVPNATVIVCGDIEIYILPRNAEYNYTVSGAGPGEYKSTVFSPGEFSPGEYSPGEYGPGEYGPGEFGEYSPGEYSPGEFTGKIYCFESNTSIVTVDSFTISMDAGTVNITSNEDKYYSMYVVNGTQMFVVTDMSISSGSLQLYTVTDWDKLGSATEAGVILCVDDDNDGIIDFTKQLTSGSKGADIIRTKTMMVGVSNVTVKYMGPAALNIKPSTGIVPDNLIGIGVFVEVTGVAKNIMITIQYTPEQLKNAGIKASDLRMYYWNETIHQWIKIGNSGVWENNNTVWANVEHLTIFAPMAEKVAEAPPVNWLLYIGILAAVIIVVIAVAVIARLRKKKL